MKTPTCKPPQKYFPNRLLAERQPLPVLELAMNSKQYTNSFSASRMIHDRCLIDCHVLLVNADMESNRFCAVQFRRRSEGQTLIHILCYTPPHQYRYGGIPSKPSFHIHKYHINANNCSKNQHIPLAPWSRL